MNMLELFLVPLFCVGICIEYRRSYHANNEKRLYELSLFSTIILSKYVLSFHCMLALTAFLGFLILIYKSMVQKSDTSLNSLALIFLLMGMVFFAQQFLGIKLWSKPDSILRCSAVLFSLVVWRSESSESYLFSMYF